MWRHILLILKLYSLLIDDKIDNRKINKIEDFMIKSQIKRKIKKWRHFLIKLKFFVNYFSLNYGNSCENVNFEVFCGNYHR